MGERYIYIYIYIYVIYIQKEIITNKKSDTDTKFLPANALP